MNISDALPEFISESNELLREMEAGLLDCAKSPTPESVNLIFRCAHTIKGSAGLFGLDHIVQFVHVIETLLDQVRQGAQPLSERLINLLLSCKDHISVLITLVESADAVPRDLEMRSTELERALREFSANDRKQCPESHATRSEQCNSLDRIGVQRAETQTHWHLCARFSTDVLQAGMDPLAFIRYLGTFCDLNSVVVLEDRLPKIGQFNPECCYLGFEIQLATAEPRERILGAFEFVQDDCTISLSAVQPELSKDTSPDVLSNRSTTPQNESPRKQSRTASIRVDTHKLDELIGHVGELIIASAGATLAARRISGIDLTEHTSRVAALVEEVRESALRLRMVKIGGVFDRFKRIVRDISADLGKSISLQISGEDTELDKILVEQITDPLTHLVRNAMDHGIEAPNVRVARGKAAAGRVTLNAFHDSGSIVIEVSDDGGGLQRDRILAKAVERGLVDQSRELTDAEVFNLIFEPGFSTAEAVTDLSGRGVGMDVVKRNITALRGRIDLRSSPGSGTTVSIRLPLTLAIINGFQVSVGNSNFVLPLESIEECIEFMGDCEHEFINLRGELLPFVRLRNLMRIPGESSRRQSVVVVRHGAERAGLVVDCLLGESQTVIKPLGKMFRNVTYVTGSSILGNGDVALILDIPALVREASQTPSPTLSLRIGA